MRVWASRLSLVALLAALPVGAQSPVSAPARFTFIKVFPGSLPEYMALTIAEDGTASYDGRALAEPARLDPFHLPADVVARLFGLAAELSYFEGVQLDAGRKIANLGEKTFRYERGGQRAEVRFNYTENRTASVLLDLCEKIARGRFHMAQLEFKSKYDRLGLLGAMREFESEFNRRGFVYLEQFVPVLTQLAGDARVVRLVQLRAQRLLERIQGSLAQVHYEFVREQEGWYENLSLHEDGRGSYEMRRTDQPSDPQPFEVSPRLSARVFDLLRQANNLRDLGAYREAGKAAGIRLIYEAGPEYNQVTFTTPPTGHLAELVRLFGQTLTQIEFRTRLARALDKDTLQLPDVLRDLEQAVSRGALAEPFEFVPLLEKVAQDRRYEEEHGLARKILDKIRSGR